MQIHDVVLQAVLAIRGRILSHEHSLTSIVDLATLVADADGVIDEQEEAALGAWLSRLLNQELGVEGVRSLVRSSLAVARGVGASAVMHTIAREVVACDVSEEAVLIALAVGYASEGLSSVERALVDQFALAVGLPPERVDALANTVEAALGASSAPPSSAAPSAS